MADRTSNSLGISNGNALAPEDTESLLLTRRAARASGSFVKEVERRLVEAPTILLGNGNERVALGMDELVPTVNLFVGTGAAPGSSSRRGGVSCWGFWLQGVPSRNGAPARAVGD